MRASSWSGWTVAGAFALVLLGCDPVTVVRTTARETHAVEATCSVEALRSEFPGAEVRWDSAGKRVVVHPYPDGAFTVGLADAPQGEITAEAGRLGKASADQLARMESLERRALQSVLARCAHAEPAQFSCWSSKGPTSGVTCFLNPPSTP